MTRQKQKTLLCLECGDPVTVKWKAQRAVCPPPAMCKKIRHLRQQKEYQKITGKIISITDRSREAIDPLEGIFKKGPKILTITDYPELGKLIDAKLQPKKDKMRKTSIPE